MIYIWLCDDRRSGALDCVNIISNSIFQAFIPFWTSFEVLQFVFQVEQFRRSVFWFPFVCALFLSSYHLLHHLYLKEIIFVKYKQNCARNEMNSKDMNRYNADQKITFTFLFDRRKPTGCVSVTRLIWKRKGLKMFGEIRIDHRM